MSSVSGIRLPGLATGMDTEAMVKEMLTADQNKIDKVTQKEQAIKWQQEIYRDIIKDIQGLNDKYFSLTSKNSIVSSSAWNTLTISSSNSNIITAKGTSGADKVDYKFEVKKLAESARITSSKTDLNKNSKLIDIGAIQGESFKFDLGKDKDGKVIYSKEITIDENDTINSLVKKINESTDGKIVASFSEMTGKFSIETKDTGANANLSIVGSDALKFLGLKTDNIVINDDGTYKREAIDFDGTTSGSNSIVDVKDKEGNFIKTLKENSNAFTIDGVEYSVHSVGISEITSKQDVQHIIDNMKAFVEDYNALMDNIYDLVTQKTNRDYPPLTESQKQDMSEEEIERWEEKAKKGVLRNDSEMRRFMEDMQKSIFGDNMAILSQMGMTSHTDYNKKGQVTLDVDKFTKALETNADKVYEVFAKDSSSVMERLKSTIKDYTGGSSSVFAKKAGIEKTASVAKNFYSEQLKRQADTIKKLQSKMYDKENALYKKFGSLESSMNKLNSQMSYFMQM